MTVISNRRIKLDHQPEHQHHAPPLRVQQHQRRQLAVVEAVGSQIMTRTSRSDFSRAPRLVSYLASPRSLHASRKASPLVAPTIQRG